MKRNFIFIGLAILGFSPVVLTAQTGNPLLDASRIPPRVEDHFWRRKVVNRIDLGEKINLPLTEVELSDMYSKTPFPERRGIVVALLNGLKSGKFGAYSPDSLNKFLTWEDVQKIAADLEGQVSSLDDEDSGDDFGDDFSSDEDMGSEDEMVGEDDFGGENDSDPFSGGKNTSDFPFQTTSFESLLDFIEDRIFDKNRSDMVYDIQYLRLVWVDPAEVLPEKSFICFKYSDILETLENTMWKNKFNDAEYRNLREIFELRLFQSYILNVSGRSSQTLDDAEYKRNQLVEFEHHLWSY